MIETRKLEKTLLQITTKKILIFLSIIILKPNKSLNPYIEKVNKID
jgi:hypothetical protein